MPPSDTPTYYAVPTAVLLTRPFRMFDAFTFLDTRPEPPREPAFLGDLLVNPLPAPGRENSWQVLDDAPGLAESGLHVVKDLPMHVIMGVGIEPPPAVAGPETREQHDARLAEKAREAAKLREAWRLYDDALRAVPVLLRDGTGFQEPAGTLAHAALAVWNLHAPVLERGCYPVCEGCDPGPYADGRPEWPCSTAEALAGALDVPLPDHHDLAPRPEGTDQ